MTIFFSSPHERLKGNKQQLWRANIQIFIEFSGQTSIFFTPLALNVGASFLFYTCCTGLCLQPRAFYETPRAASRRRAVAVSRHWGDWTRAGWRLSMVSDNRRKRGVDETVRSHVTLRDVTEHHFVKEQHEDRRKLHLRTAGSACRYRDIHLLQIHCSAARFIRQSTSFCCNSIKVTWCTSNILSVLSVHVVLQYT